MNKVAARAFGKINLSLDVFSKRGEKHPVDTVTTSISLFDDVTVSRADKFSCNLSASVPDEKNTAVRAAKAFCEEFALPPVHVEIEKHIPMGQGLGGSSADAAGTLFALSALYEIPLLENVYSIAAKIGSDVPLMLRGGFVRAQGFGEKLTKIDCDKTLFVVVASSCDFLSTAECYAKFDLLKKTVPSLSDAVCDALSSGAPLYNLSNALCPAAKAIRPEIAVAEIALMSLSEKPCAVNMTGSGAAFYGLFETEEAAKRAERELHSQNLHFVSFATSTPYGVKLL